MHHSVTSTTLEVHAWVDIACPWCWIAKRRFEAAVAEFGGEVDVEYNSWELAPDLPPHYLSSEVDFLQLLYAGTTLQGAQEKVALVTSTGAKLGLAYDFDAVQHTSTGLAHQLLHHAKAHGLQKPMLETLFSAFFEQGRDLRGIDVLVTLAGDAGLDANAARQSLEQGEYAEAVRADRQRAALLGITNIPTYVIAGGEPIHGAKRPAVLVEALRKASAANAE